MNQDKMNNTVQVVLASTPDEEIMSRVISLAVGICSFLLLLPLVRS